VNRAREYLGKRQWRRYSENLYTTVSEVDDKMPTYEYECRSCGHVTDVFHNMTAKPRVKCPECGGRTKKLFGAGAGIIFKGSGFYETDYKRRSVPRNGEAKTGAQEPKPSGSASEGSSESKTTAKTGAA
jgi:putative FmdB family regulatory protein